MAYRNLTALSSETATLPTVPSLPLGLNALIEKYHRAHKPRFVIPDSWRNQAGEDYRAGLRATLVSMELRLKHTIARRLGVPPASLHPDTMMAHMSVSELTIYLECSLMHKETWINEISEQKRVFEYRAPLF